MAIDPVCDMRVDPESAAGSAEWQGTVYYFCSPGCLNRFEEGPAKYLESGEQPSASSAAR